MSEFLSAIIVATIASCFAFLFGRIIGYGEGFRECARMDDSLDKIVDLASEEETGR